MPNFPKILSLRLCYPMLYLDLVLHVFNFHAVGFDGSDYPGDGGKGGKGGPGGDGDRERHGEGDHEDKGGKGECVHF